MSTTAIELLILIMLIAPWILVVLLAALAGFFYIDYRRRERPPPRVTMTPEQLRRSAVHEAGHVLMALVSFPHCVAGAWIHKDRTEGDDRPHGEVELHRDKWPRTRAEEEDELGMSYGGYLAEQLIYGEVDSGSAEDVTHATNRAHFLAGYYRADGGAPINADGLPRDEAFALAVRRAAIRLLDEQFAKAAKHVAEHRRFIEILAEVLEEKLELSGDELRAKWAAYNLTR